LHACAGSGKLCIALRHRPGWWTPATVIATFAATLAAFRESRRDRPRLRAPACALVLFAARRRGDDRQARGAGQSRSAARARAPPHLEPAARKGETHGLLALTGGPSGPLDRAIAAGQGELAAGRLQTLLELFGDGLYVELQRHGSEPERHAEPLLIELAYR